MGKNIVSAIYSLKGNGGFSYSFWENVLNPENGYMVAISKEDEKVIPFNEETLFADVESYIMSNILLLLDSNRYLGAWLHNGYLHLDVSECVSSLEEAVKLSIERDQKAFWDCSNKKEILLETL